MIENCDEWIYCLDGTNGRVMSWSSDTPEEEYSDFDSYFLDRLKDAAENL